MIKYIRIRVRGHSSKNGTFFFLSFFFLGPHLWHMEIPRLGVKSELQLPVCARATAARNLSQVCNLHHSNLGSPTH